MDLNFPQNKDVEHAQEKILQAKSALEIKELLKQDEPQRPNYQEALIRLVSRHIMKQIPSEEIDRIEKLSPNKLTRYPVEEDRERSYELGKLASKFNDSLAISVINNAAQKHDPINVPKEQREYIEPEKSVGLSIINSVYDHVKKHPNMIEETFKNILPNLRQDKPLDHQIETAKKAGYVQGVCECVAAIGEDHTLGKKLLTEMNVTKDMAKKFANPETFKALEQGIFAHKPEQTLKQTQSFKR